MHEFVTPASLVSQSNSTDVRLCFTRAHLCSLTHDCIVRLSTAKRMFTRFACSRLLTRVSRSCYTLAVSTARQRTSVPPFVIIYDTHSYHINYTIMCRMILTNIHIRYRKVTVSLTSVPYSRLSNVYYLKCLQSHLSHLSLTTPITTLLYYT